MSAVPNVLAAGKDSEQAFLESQKLPPDRRGVSFEALFFRQLQQVTTQIHATENVEQIMLEVSADIGKLLNADRLTLYAVTEDQASIVSKVKTGLNSSRELKLPISPQSLAGFVALSKKLLNLADVYDEEALQRIHPALRFLKEVDKRSGYRSRQMIVAPILEGDVLHGVLQVINNKADRPFSDLDVEGVSQLCKTLATAIRQRMQRAAESHKRKATRYDALVTGGWITDEALQQALEQSHKLATPVERILAAEHRLQPAQIGAALSGFFGVGYEPFSSGRIRSEALHGALKREFVEQAGWIPRRRPRTAWSSCAWTRRRPAVRAWCPRSFRRSAGSPTA